MFGITSGVAAILSFAITALLGFVFIPFLKRLHFGQTIKEIGPTWHKSKQGTPMMGGLMFVIGMTVAAVTVFLMFPQEERSALLNQGQMNARLIGGYVMALASGFMGFMDDYIKGVKKQNLGLRARDKIAMQVLITVGYLLTLYLAGDHSTVVWFPFLGAVDFGLFYYPFSAFLIIGFVNAVNLTDGIDGLATSVTFIYALAFVFLSGLLGMKEFSVLSIVIAAGCLGFLVWNFHPAKVFMGDTGSMFLGGLVVALAFGVGMPLLLLLCGLVYLCEALSVMFQVPSFKLTGKRIFKMSPIHHHFELCHFSENQIVALFSFVGALGCAAAVLAVVLR